MTADRPAEPRSILVVLLGALGDVARGFAVLPPLKARFPDARVSWLVEPASAGLVRLHPMVDEVVVFGRGGGIRAAARTAAELRRKRFDVVLDLQRHAKSGFFSASTGAPRRIGFHRRDAKEFNWLFSNERIAQAPPGESKVLHYLRFADALGAPRPGPGEPVAFGLPRPSPPGRDAGRRVGVVLGSSWRSKDWPAEGYGALLPLLVRDGFVPVLLGDSSRRGLADRLVRTVAEGTAVDLVGKTDLAGLVGAVGSTVACVGPDSGPGHVAAALGVPYVGLFGPTDPDRTAPYGSRRLAVASPVGCAGCRRRECPGMGNVCMRLLSPAAVALAVGEAAARGQGLSG